jgi:hypothetical protein
VGALVSHRDAIDAIMQLRASGALRVRVGDIEAEWSSAPTAAHESPRPEEPTESPEQRAERERREYEETLNWSTPLG